jgi:hypothetical protein
LRDEISCSKEDEVYSWKIGNGTDRYIRNSFWLSGNI